MDDSPVIDWRPESQLDVAGRGLVMVGPYPFEHLPARNAIGRVLRVDGRRYVISGVEWSGWSRIPPEGSRVGLVVRIEN